ncbi:hypothetical protein EWB00_010101 [Schistosoma japonicum]|uniref:Uncharacterized protein n=1 Tax=Schistosoma japonicum TaxID=6182 RepID=A0A4Z2DQ22_SCHJA|nr:hypothetical protein EWB00_010101 [Schistosoma japonicum]
MKFIIRVGGMTFKTVGILSSGEVYLARLFTHGNPIRTIRVVNGTSTDNAPVIFNGDNTFSILWFNIHYCKSNPREEGLFYLFIHRNGTLQFALSFASHRSVNCHMTLEILDGIYNGSS